MSKIPEACIEAASLHETDNGYAAPTKVARRVILALADNLPDSAVDTALDEMLKQREDNKGFWYDLRAALVAALKEVGGE